MVWARDQETAGDSGGHKILWVEIVDICGWFNMTQEVFVRLAIIAIEVCL